MNRRYVVAQLQGLRFCRVVWKQQARALRDCQTVILLKTAPPSTVAHLHDNCDGSEAAIIPEQTCHTKPYAKTATAEGLAIAMMRAQALNCFPAC